MLLPPIWRGRRKDVPARSRIAQFRAVVRAAQSVEGYRERLKKAGLDTPERLNEVRDVEQALQGVAPLALTNYQSLFTQRKPAWRRVPHSRETRSALMLPYADARKGVGACHNTPPEYAELYSTQGTVAATADLINLSRALSAPQAFNWKADHAMIVFSGIDAGLVSEEQREDLWERYQVPLFEQFVGTDGRVVAAECEVHSGLHIRTETAVFECVDEELVMTSLTDEQSPALRMRSGICGGIDHEACECGRVEPRIVGLRSMAQPHAAAAIA